MSRLVYFAPRSGLTLVDQLSQAGCAVYETLAMSEVLHLIEYEQIDAMLIAPEITTAQRVPIKERTTCLELTAKTTAAALIFALSHLFPTKIPLQ